MFLPLSILAKIWKERLDYQNLSFWTTIWSSNLQVILMILELKQKDSEKSQWIQKDTVTVLLK